jgi:hypothetical protein
MRLRIAHSIVRHYDPPAASAIQVLRLTPRNHEGQYVIDWRIDVSADARLVTRTRSATSPMSSPPTARSRS